jgi:pimeloyl-ACP methyl ester carboxylesterase
MAAPIPTVFIPALLCDERLYTDVIAALGDHIEAHVMISPKPTLQDSVTNILAHAPPTFALVGTSYAGNLALEIALAAPERVTALWLMGCDPAAAAAGGPDLAAGLEATPDAVIDMLAGLVVPASATAQAVLFKSMAANIGSKAGAAQARALAARRDLTGELGKLKMPALVVWGKDDPLVPVAVGRAMAEALPHAHFFALNGTGHLPTLEKPEEAAMLFADFLHDEPHHH